MARETSEPINPIDDRQDWMGRDINNVEIYGSDIINREVDSGREFDRHKAMMIGSAAVAAAAIATIVLIKHKRQRDGEESSYEIGTEFGALAAVRSADPSRIRRLADRQLQRVGNTVEDIIDALVGVAVGKAVSLVADAVPAFRSEFDRTSMDR